MGHEDNKQSKGTNWWFFRGITDASITLSEDLPAIAKPFVRILALAILSILTVLMIPWFIFRRFFPAKYAENPFTKARSELEATWYEESP